MRRLGLLAFAAVPAWSVFAMACANSSDPRAGEDAASSDDAGPTAVDAAASDGPAAPPAETRNDSGFAGCLDGIDGDSDSEVDCSDTAECGLAPVCCVGATRSGCCTAASDVTVPLGDCAAGTCGGLTATVFGAPILSAGMHPSSEDADGGVVLAAPHDPRQGDLRLTTHLVAEADGSLDFVSFGWVAQPEGSARVVPVVAVQLNVALDRVSLVVGEDVVDEATGASTGEYWLAITPDGTVSAGRGAETLVETTGLRGGTSVYPVVFGRSSSATGTHLTDVTIGRSVCDIPAALDVEAIELIDEVLAFVPGTEANPSLARGGDGILRLAFDAVRVGADRRGIFIAEETAPGRFVVRNPSPELPQPVIGDLTDADEVSDPELTWTGSRWELYFAGRENMGSTLFSTASTDDRLAFVTPTRLGRSIDMLLDSPARDPASAERLYARLTDGSGRTQVVSLDITPADATAGFETADDICSVDVDCSLDGRASFVVRNRASSTLFDADEVDAPSAVLTGTVHRLYYVGRRANQWVLSVVVSEDGMYWRRLSETVMGSDVVLGVDPELAPLGIRGASVLVDGDVVRIVAEGYAGLRSRFLIATQPL